MQSLLIVTTLLVAVISSCIAIALATLVTRGRLRSDRIGASTYLVGWLLFIWPFPILAVASAMRLTSGSTAVIYALAGCCSLVGAMIIVARYFITSMVGWRNDVRRGKISNREVVANYLHWLGLLTALLAIGMFGLHPEGLWWIGAIALAIGALMMICARIVQTYQHRSR